MARTPLTRLQATEAVGKPIAEWIEELRTSGPRLTYPQIARLLAADYDVHVASETLRAWHQHAGVEPSTAEPAQQDGSAA